MEFFNPYTEKAMKLNKDLDKPGIYCIKLQGKKVYVGKSRNMLNRVAAHMQHIYSNTPESKGHKYQILKQADKQKMAIEFDVLYYSTKTEQVDIDEDIGSAEALFINYYMPSLNVQIPKIDNWNSHTMSKTAQTITLEEIVQ